MRTSQASGALEEAFAREWIRAFTEAWNEHDADAIASMCTEDVLHKDPALRAPEYGRDGFRDFAADLLRAFPDLRVDIQEEPGFVLSEPRIFVAYRLSGTMLGPFDHMGLAATGRAISVDAVDDYSFRGELACAIHTHIDLFEMGRQLGSLPAQDSRTERLMLPIQRLQAVYLRRRSAS
ncbi:MAG TPA: ester cyclase [Solirubrobacterales bacterium]|jgi:steroid delta-isomerase-like uncharacterized protein|nr:ester cyclase [Solirubrobacterales bacterium]